MDPARQVAAGGSGFYAALACAALLIVAAALVRLVPPDPAYLRATFTIEHVEFLGMFDNRGQQWAHRAVLALLGVFAAAAWFLRPRLPEPPAQVRNAVRYGGVALLVLYVLLVWSEGRPLVGDVTSFHGRYALFPVLSLRTQLVLSLIGMAGIYLWLWLPGLHSVVRTAAAAGTLAYVSALVILGLVRDPSFQGFTPALVSGVEWHYSGAISSADRLALGERLGEVPIHSSLLGSVLLGAWQRANGLLDFGGHIRLLAVLQSLMIALAVIAYGAWYGWRSGGWILALLLVLPWMQPLQAAVLYPNQSAWRFLGLCAGLALLVLAHARSVVPISALLGAAGGFALLWNAETGIVLNGAYVVFLVLRNAPAGKAAGAYLAGLAAALLAFCVIGRYGLGYWPDLVAIAQSFPLIGNFSRGYGGLGFNGVDALALLVFAHSLYLVARGILDWTARPTLPPREAARVAIAALLVAWAAYYFKAPHPWNLWSSLLIYGLLLGDLFLRRAAIILGAVVLPAILATNAAALNSIARAARQPPCPAASVLSGICMPGNMAELERAKADALRRAAAERPVLYFTADSYLMPLLSGVSPAMRYRDAFSDVVLAADFAELVAHVRQASPACILYDDPASPLSGYEAHRAFYARVRAALSGDYERRGAAHGWETYCISFLPPAAPAGSGGGARTR